MINLIKEGRGGEGRGREEYKNKRRKQRRRGVNRTPSTRAIGVYLHMAHMQYISILKHCRIRVDRDKR